MKKPLFTLFLACMSFMTFAQANLSSKLESLKGLLTEVETKSSIITQSLEWDEAKPQQVKLLVEETSKKKGKVKSTTYAFSLADVDLNAVRSKTAKDVVEVGVFMKSRQKLVIYSEEGEFKSYVNTLAFYAASPDDGEAIETAIKEAVKIAVELPSPCANLGDGAAWLEANIGAFSLGKETKEQEIKVNGILADYLLVSQGKKTKEEKWHFNFADLSKRSVQLQFKSKEFYVDVKTKRSLKYIHYSKDGKVSHIARMKFYVADFEKAKCLVTVLETIIEDSEKKEKSAQLSFSSSAQALEALAGLTGNVDGAKSTINQELKPNCATALSGTDAKGKDKMVKFNFLDINPKKIDITIKGKLVALKLGSKSKLIQTYKDGEIKSYTNKFILYAKDIEEAKVMKIAAVAAAKQCKTETTFMGFPNAKENFDWLSKQLKDHAVIALDQSVELVEGDACKWKFTSIKSGKKSVEETLEFSLSDLDEDKVKWDVSGKKLAIEIGTRHKEKLIKYYKDGEPGNYKNTFSIQFDDVEAARKSIAVLKKAIKSCQD